MVKYFKNIRYPISSIFMIVGYILGFIAMYNGLALYDYCIKYERDINEYEYKHCKKVQLSSLDGINHISTSPLINSSRYIYYLKDEVLLYFDNDKKERLVDILFSVNENTNYCMQEGRIPNLNDIKEGKNVVSIGKELKASTYTKGKKRYINIYSTPYEVVGIIGTGISKAQDYKVVTYYQCLDKRSKEEISLVDMNVTVASNSENIDLNGLIRYYEKNKNVNLDIVSEDVLEDMVLSDERARATFYFLTFAFCIFNCIIVCEFWIDQRRREFAIRKAYGYSNGKIINIVALSLVKHIVFSCILGYILQVAFMRVMNDNEIYMEWSIINLVRIFVIIILTTMISLLIPMNQVLKRLPILEITQKEVV